MLINAMAKIVTILGRKEIRSNDKSIITYRLENWQLMRLPTTKIRNKDFIGVRLTLPFPINNKITYIIFHNIF